MLSHFIRVQLFVIPWTVAHQSPLSMGFSMPEYWSGYHFLLQGVIQGSNLHCLWLLHCRWIPSRLSHKFSSVQFSCSVVSDSLWLHGMQHVRAPCPSPTPWVYPNSCPLNQWYHPTISSSVIPFSSCLQSIPASESFPMSQFFTSQITSVIYYQCKDYH